MSQDILDQIRQDYRQILQDPKNSILTGDRDSEIMSAAVGYTPEELAQVPREANLGLGCGNPLRAADLKPGEVVIDLGSGAGLDTFLPSTPDPFGTAQMQGSPALHPQTAESCSSVRRQPNRRTMLHIRLR